MLFRTLILESIIQLNDKQKGQQIIFRYDEQQKKHRN